MLFLLFPHLPTLFIPPFLKRLLFLNLLQAPLGGCFSDDVFLRLLLGEDIGH